MTEKDYNPKQKEKKAMEKQTVEKGKEKPVEAPKQKQEKKDEKKTEKKQEKKPDKPKKTEAIVNGISLPISTKTSAAICRFIKGKNIQKVISDLEQVISCKKPVPMKGEIPHRKGKIMSGRYPKKASEYFIKLLNTLQANANVNGLENPIIIEAIANIASQPYGKFGRVRRKRSHVKIVVKEKKGGKKK